MEAFSAFTLCWIVIGLVGGGDFFAQGKAIAFVALAAGTGGGMVVGARATSRWARATTLALAAGCLAFWFLVPDGWWALPPPTRDSVRVDRAAD